MQRLFFELIQVSIGNKERLSKQPSDREWECLFEMAQKQSLGGFLFEGFSKCLPEIEGGKPSVFFEWIGLQQQVIAMNKLQNQRSKELYDLFKEAGFNGAVLKGQGTAMYYPHPEYRACGDIDFWVTKDGRCKTNDVRNEVLQFVKTKGYHIGRVDIKHSDIDFFEDVPVEVHFLPSWMYCPSTNNKLQRFFKEKVGEQTANFDEQLGFSHTTIDFDLVYSIVHIYRHIFSEGIGLRQLVDYYYILQSSSEEQRESAFMLLKSLNMKSFVGGVMWILMECFGMNIKYSLCPANEKHGKFLLSEIMAAGNFGQYDARMKRVSKNKKIKRGIVQFEKNLRFVGYYPSEVLWSPVWKLWHWCWRKRNGFI